MAVAERDDNNVPTLIGVSSVDLSTPTKVAVNPVNGRVLVDLPTTSSLSMETPTGTVNGVNVTFTTTNTPKEIHADGNIYISGDGFSYASPTITMDIAPIRWIRNIY